ncbi:MAG TPA: hypothetical protein VLF43_01340, partial [Candidatus Saccharimonadales bacterium]|nr:hypothetical protein [Candidatus Saccharimonadales bacterium]
MAELDHLAWTINENKIGQKLPIFLKEQAYASMSAVWRAFGDNMKLGDLDIEQVNVLNASVIGVEGAATYNYLFKGVATVGEVVDPRIDSNVDNSLASAQDFIYKKTGRRISHEILNIWYQTVSSPLNALEDWGFGLLFKFIGALGAFALFTNAMSAMFGENWQEDLAKWSADSLMQILGLVVDPLATGAQLFNNLYVGGDVIMNKYCQTNLGCMALSTAIKSGIFGTNQMLQEDRELYNSSLSIQERLFSFDEPGSLANAVVREMPDTMSPGSTFGVIVSQVTQLPTRLLGVMTGRAFAAETPNQDAAVDGVEQFGVSTDAQLDRDVNSKVREEADPVCPDNDKSKINECQTDKEVMTVAFCHSTNCPQFVESSSAPIEAPDTGTGPVATTGDIKALAAKLLALHDSGQIKMNPEVVQDLTKTKNGDPIGSCGVQDLDAALLNLLIRIASKYKFTMWNIVTGHGCNYAPHHFHPKGMASDIGAVNGEAANLGGGFRPLMDATLAREFALFVAGSMPKGRGGMGQSDCTVLVPVNNWPAGVEMFTGDGCNHFHVDVGDYSS